MNARYQRSDSRPVSSPTMRDLSLVEIERWCGILRHCLQIPLQRLTDRERFDLLSNLGKLERTAAEFLPPEAESLRAQAQDKLTHEPVASLTQALSGHALASWSHWTLEARHKPSPEILWEMLAALDDAESAVAVVAGLHPRAIDPTLDDLLSRCRSWIERNGAVFAPLRAEVERLYTSLQPELADEDYDLGVTLLKFEAILDPLSEEGPVEPAPFTSAVLDALLHRPT